MLFEFGGERRRRGIANNDVVDTLERIAAGYGRPKRIRVANSPVVLDFSRPGKPTVNAFAESFNEPGRCRSHNDRTKHGASLFLGPDSSSNWRKKRGHVRTG